MLRHPWVFLQLGGGKPVPSRSDDSQVALTEREQQLLEAILKSKPFGGTEIVLDEAIQQDPDLTELLDRLGWGLTEQR